MSHAAMPPWTDVQAVDEAARRLEWATRFGRRYRALGDGLADADSLLKQAYALYDAPGGLASIAPEAAAWEALRRDAVR